MRRLAVLAVAACVTGAHAEILFMDGFETGDLSLWPFTTNPNGVGPAVVDATGGNFVHGGTFAAKLSENTGLSTIIRKAANLSRPVASGEMVQMTFWMYDPTGSGSAGTGRQYMELRSYAGNAYTSGALENLWALGKYNAATSQNSAKYQARVAFAGVNWVNVSNDRAIGWHEFKMVIDDTNADFYVDGVLGLSTPRGAAGSVDSIVLGTGLSSASNPAWIDDIKVEIVPEPATLAALGLGIVILARRRR